MHITVKGNKKILFVLWLVAVILFVRGVRLNADVKEYKQNCEIYQNIDHGWISLKDTYDRDDYSFSDFLQTDQALTIEKKTYQDLKKSNLDYYEFYENQVNIETDKVFSGVSMDEKSWKKWNISERISDGKNLQKKDFALTDQDEIPVLLGSNLKKQFHIGQTFQGENYVSMKCRVAGFLKPGQTIEMDDESISLDDCILSPMLNLSEKDSKRDQAILLSVKLEGKVYYKDANEYQNVAQVVQQIRAKTGFEYVQIQTTQDVEKPFSTSVAAAEKQVVFYLVLAGIVMALSLILYNMRDRFKFRVNLSNNETI